MKLRSFAFVFSFALIVATTKADDPLPSWNDTAPKEAIVAFVEKVTKVRLARFRSRGRTQSKQSEFSLATDYIEMKPGGDLLNRPRSRGRPSSSKLRRFSLEDENEGREGQDRLCKTQLRFFAPAACEGIVLLRTEKNAPILSSI
jgi:hypothetical protein